MSSFLSFFLDWKVKIAIALVVISAAYFWHLSEVKVAVNEAVTQIETQATKERFKLLDKANEESFKLKEQIAKNKQEKDRELQIVNTKYNNLLAWVRNLPSTTGSSDSAGDSRDSEARREEVIAELRRKHAESLAEYSHGAEEVRIKLLQCYRDYDAVKKARDKFVEENTPKTQRHILDGSVSD